jgi:hypothetical protein
MRVIDTGEIVTPRSIEVHKSPLRALKLAGILLP